MRNTLFTKVIVLAASLFILSGCEPVPEDPNNPPPNNPGSGSGSGNISNQRPVAVISPGAEQYLTVGEGIYFNGSGSYDPDGNTPLSYQWTFTGAATSLDTYNSVTPGLVSFEEEGGVNVNLVVTDNRGLSSVAASVTVYVFNAQSNRAPNGFITHDNGTGATGSTGNINITTGSSVTFDGDAIDADGDPISYFWNFSAGISAPASPGSAPFSISFPSAGIYTITLNVADNQGNYDPSPAQVTVTVTDTPIPVNLPPNGTITHDNGTGATGSTGNISITAGGTVVFDGNATDPENNPVTYSWSFPANVTAPASPGGAPFSVSFPTAGIYVISLTVSDNQGNTDPTPAQVTVTVTNTPTPVNLPPNGIITHDNGTGATGSTGNISITTGTTVVFDGNATDPENNPVTYSWSFPANVTAPASPGGSPFNVSFPTAGIYVISLTVSDNQGNTDPTPAQVTVTVTNTPTPVNLPPNGTITHDNGTGATGSTGNISINTGGTVVFDGNATDPENNPVTYSWSFPANVTAPASPGGSPFNVSFPTAGVFVISLTVSDNQGNTDPTPAQVTVTVTDAPPPVNLPPDGSITHNNGTGAPGSTGNINIRVGTTVVFQGLASDPENDPITFSWQFNGGTASSTTISGPINVRYTTPGTFLVRLTVSDSNGNIDPTPAELTVNVRLQDFKYLPVLSDQDGNPSNSSATYNLSVNSNVAVNVATLDGTWITPMMRYNSLQLPPVIKARRGMQMRFNVSNNLSEDTTIHWHGFQIPAAQDGGPDMPIAPGGQRTYTYTLMQPAGPLWFHPHAHGTTATQVYRGLAGAMIVSDSITDNLEANNQIPSGAQDIALLLQDRSFSADNGTGTRNLVYQAGGMTGMLGMLGDRVLVNGVEMPELSVSTRQYRFRIYNGSNARTYDVALSDRSFFRVVGTDGGLLNSPVLTDHVMLGAGERAEIVIDFANYSIGENLRLVSRSFNAGGMMGGGALAKFRVATAVNDTVNLYTSLPASADINTRLTAGQATAIRTFVMSVQMMPMRFLINGQTFDINRVDELVASGATEIWEISNTSTMAHPFHAHASA